MMRSFVNKSGEVTMVTGVHSDHAKNVMGLSLAVALKSHARVHVFKRHFVLETSQACLTAGQKRAANKLYKDYDCVAYTIQVHVKYVTSDMFACVRRIKWNEFN